MRILLIAAVLGLGLTPQSPAQAPPEKSLQITFEPNGRVSLVADNVTLREILAAWTREGGCQFVNGERLTGGPITVRYEHQPETDVVASLLKQTAGYILGPRREGAVGASRFEAVYITPTSRPTASGVYVPPQAASRPGIATAGSPDDEVPPVSVVPGAPGEPQSQQQQQQRPQTPDYATRPGSVAVPVVPIVPVTTSPPPTGRGGSTGAGS
jgi:hypothetical protein